MRTYAIDFETYYDQEINIKNLGLYGYIRHPKSKPYIVAVVGDDGTEYVGDVLGFDWGRLDGQRLVAHHSNFDRLVLSRLDLNIAPKEWQCTSSLSAYLGAGHSLKQAAESLLGITLNKGIRDSLEGMDRQSLPITILPIVEEYCLKDAKSSLMLWKKFSDHWPEHEQKIAQITYDIGNYGIPVDEEELEKSLKKAEEIKYEALLEIPWEEPILSRKSISEYCLRQGIIPPASFADNSSEFVEWEAKYAERLPCVAAIKNYRKANILAKKIRAIGNRVFDGRCRYGLKYFGAFTGRWSGEDGLNMQNLNKEEFLGINLRKIFRAPKGKKFLIFDFEQIEPRVIYTLTGDRKMLESIRHGENIYQAHARQTMGFSGKNLKSENPSLYALAKARVLGLGYGCGAKRFREIASTMYGLNMSPKEAENVVRSYRSSSKLITSSWAQYEASINHQMLLSRSPKIKLPSGRKLVYRDVRKINGQIVTGENTIIFGGKIFEHVVSSTARDIFAEKLLALHELGYRIVFHCHDELVLEVDSDFDAQENLVKILCHPPEWLPEIPLNVSATLTDTYWHG